MIISRNVRLCNSFFAKGTGLMFRFPKDFAYIFEFKTAKQRAITMLFVFYSIDIVFVDEGGRIVEVKRNLRSFTHFFPRKKSFSFIELPTGSIEKNKLKVGTMLKWSSHSLQKV